MQLIFFVPGIDETLRVGGKGALSAEPELLATMEEFGKLPRAALCIEVQRSLFPLRQGADAFKAVVVGHAGRTRQFPSIGEVIYDQTRLGEPEPQAVVEERYKTQL